MAVANPSIADCLSANPRPSGFDYLRMVLALLLIADHSVVACLGEVGQRALFSSPGRPIMVSLVPMFFALSGFLVAASLVRTKSLATFIGLRILRIFPALAVDTLFTALVIGVCLTQLPLSAYFTSMTFYKYLLNIVGHIHYELPGVFQENPIKLVNIQLWTIPFELKCYLALTAMAFLGLHRRRSFMLVASCIVMIGNGAYLFQHPLSVIDTWQLLVPCFLLGVCGYLYRDLLPWSPGLAAGSGLAALVLLYQTNAISVLAAVPLTYLTIWFGLLNPERDRLIRSGDYSYPLFLYSFPIQQALIVIFPWATLWWANLLAAIPISFALAAFSWHFVEKPFQGVRQLLGKYPLKTIFTRGEMA